MTRRVTSGRTDPKLQATPPRRGARSRASSRTKDPDHPVDVVIDLDRVRANALAIGRQTDRPVIAVVKSDAYGFGARAIGDALAGVVAEFAYFGLSEAQVLRRAGLVLGPLSGSTDAHAALSVRPAIGSVAEARAVGSLPAALNVDTGMQRFGCAPDQIQPILRTCRVAEAFTHTITVSGARRLQRLCAGKVPRLHAAGTALLARPGAWLDAVRPGLALYLGAMTVTTRLAAVRDLAGPAGYRRLRARRAGVIVCGYSEGFAPGVVLVNGRRRRVLEVGMNTSFVQAGRNDKPGDPVTLLGGGLTEPVVAKAVGYSQHEVLCRYARLGPRRYIGPR